MRPNRRDVLRSTGVAGLASVLGGTAGGQSTAADEGPPGRSNERRNMRLLGQNKLGDHGNAGEGMAIKKSSEGRYILYIGHSSYGGPIGLSVVDVTDPQNMELLEQFPIPSDDVRWNNLDISGDLLVVASEADKLGQEPAGLFFFDISDPAHPEQINFYDLSGENSPGPHFVWMVNDQYAHLSTGAGDFCPAKPNGFSQFYMILDVSDPTDPQEVSRWWYPGQHIQDDTQPPEPAQYVRLHNANVYPQRPDRAYLGYLDVGVVILDISDKTNPRLVGEFDPSPPLGGFTHTVVPLFSKDLLAVTDETITRGCQDAPKLLWFYDVSNEEYPMPIASAPRPDNWKQLCERGGRSGAHNIHEQPPDEAALMTDERVYGTFFNRGVRVYETNDRFNPEELAYYIPQAPEESPVNAVQMNDVYVDDRRVVFATERYAGGVYAFDVTV